MPAPTAPPPDGGGDVDPLEVPRDPASPPEWADPGDWAEACRIADLIEGAPTGERVVGAGGLPRAVALTMLAQDAGRGHIIKLPWTSCRAVLEALTEGERWRESNNLSDLLRAMQRYPDGVYPHDDNSGISTSGQRRPSRVEQAARLLGANDRGVRRNIGGFEPISSTMTGALGKIARKP